LLFIVYNNWVKELRFWAIIILLGIVAGALIGYGLYLHFGVTYEIIGTVRNKHLNIVGDDETVTTQRIIILIDGHILIVDRNFFYLSPETQQDRVYGSIEEGKTYKFTCWGIRIEWGFITIYPNVIYAKEVNLN